MKNHDKLVVSKGYYLIHTQVIENYGNHQGTGKFSDGSAHWKFKGGDTYLISDSNSNPRVANAVAFLSAYLHKSNSSLYMKEIPVEWEFVGFHGRVPKLDMAPVVHIDIDKYFKDRKESPKELVKEGSV